MTTIVKLGTLVTARLGSQWQAAPHPFDDGVTLIHPDGRRLRLEESEGRTYIRGQYPNGPVPHRVITPGSAWPSPEVRTPSLWASPAVFCPPTRGS